jgi:hypothetical protein
MNKNVIFLYQFGTIIKIKEGKGKRMTIEQVNELLGI